MNTEVSPPGPPVWTMLRPGVVSRASGRVRHWWAEISSAVISVTELPTWSIGVGVRVGLTTSGETTVGGASWA